MKKGRKRLVFLGLLAVALIAGLYALSTLNRARADFDPSRIAVVERGTMVRSVVATGKVEPITKVEIKSKANGIIEALFVDVGDPVKPGQVLAELDKENLLARVREAQANLKAAKAALEVAQAELKKNTIEAEGPDVDFARRAYSRAQTLFEQKLIAQSDLDRMKTDLDVAENRRRAAQSHLFITKAKISQAEANVAQAAALAERAAEELANATIRAPIHGIVLTRDVELGSPVSSILNMGAAATLVMTLGNIDQVFVRGKVDEADIGWVRLGQRARITVETFKDRNFDGKVTQISPIGTEKDNVTSFEVEISIQNPGRDLRANMTANAEIILEEHQNALTVPIAAVRYDAQKTPYVEVPAPELPNRKKRITVKLGIGNGTRTEVLEGVNQGDRIILP